MASVTERPTPSWSIARLRDHFGGIPARRIRLQPPPGTATVRDLVRANDRSGAICELVDGTLVEKPVGVTESFLAIRLGQHLNNYVDQHPLGIVLGPDGAVQLIPGLIRAADIGLYFWYQMEGGEFPKKAVPSLYPDLAIEIISRGNTKREMERKLQEFFERGARQVWLVYPRKKIIDVYTDPETRHTVGPDEVLDGGDLLPGFRLDLTRFFTLPRRPQK